MHSPLSFPQVLSCLFLRPFRGSGSWHSSAIFPLQPGPGHFEGRPWWGSCRSRCTCGATGERRERHANDIMQFLIFAAIFVCKIAKSSTCMHCFFIFSSLCLEAAQLAFVVPKTNWDIVLPQRLDKSGIMWSHHNSSIYWLLWSKVYTLVYTFRTISGVRDLLKRLHDQIFNAASKAVGPDRRFWRSCHAARRFSLCPPRLSEQPLDCARQKWLPLGR